jgi:ABC-type branched-subunit amino acid transport system ATPase component
MQVIEVTDLTKRFNSKGISFAAVDQITFTVEEREIFALLGPNGGKGKGEHRDRISRTRFGPEIDRTREFGFPCTYVRDKTW